MREQVYSDVDIRYYSDDYPIIPMTFLNTGDIPAGAVIGQKEDGYADRVRRTKLAVDAAANATELTVEDVSLYKIGNVVGIMNEDGTGIENLGAITNIIAANNIVVVTTALTAAHAEGSYVFVADGTEKALAVLSEPVIDEGEEVVANVYIGGLFTKSMISGMDDKAKADLGARSINDILVVPGF